MCHAPVERRHERFARRADATGRQSSRRAIRKQNDVRFGDRIKILVFDGTGLVLVYKRLEQGKFAWPAIRDGIMRLSRAQFEALFDGLEWQRVHGPRRVRRPTATE